MSFLGQGKVENYNLLLNLLIKSVQRDVCVLLFRVTNICCSARHMLIVQMHGHLFIVQRDIIYFNCSEWLK